MKKIVTLLLVLVLVIAMAAPANALSETSISKDGTHPVGNRTYQYTCFLGVSGTTATASITCSPATITLSATVTAVAEDADGSHFSRTNSDLVTGNVSTSVYMGATIVSVYGYYAIANTSIRTLQLT